MTPSARISSSSRSASASARARAGAQTAISRSRTASGRLRHLAARACRRRSRDSRAAAPAPRAAPASRRRRARLSCRAAVLAARHPGAEGRLAQVAARRGLQERHDQAARQRHHVAVLRRARPRPAAAAATRSSGSPSRSSGPSGSVQACSSASTFCPKAVPRLASRCEHRLQPRPLRALEPRPGADEHPVIERRAPAPAPASARAPPCRAISASTRANSAAFIIVSAWCAASLGLRSRCSASIASLVSAPARLKKTAATRSSAALGPLHRLDGVGEGRGRRIGGDGVDVGRAPPRSAASKAGAKSRGPDVAERRQPEGRRSSPRAAGSSRSSPARRPRRTLGRSGGRGQDPARRLRRASVAPCRGRRPARSRGSIRRWSAGC